MALVAREEIRNVEVRARDVDGNAEKRPPLPLPSLQQSAHLAKHVEIQLGDNAVALEERNELVRAEHTFRRDPAHERLGTDDAALGQRNLRLQIHMKLAVRKRMGKAILELLLSKEAPTEAIIIEANACAAWKHPLLRARTRQVSRIGHERELLFERIVVQYVSAEVHRHEHLLADALGREPELV